MNKAIIIGAGIAGLSSAISLQSIGYDVNVYEKANSLRKGGAGITLWNNAIHALNCLGISSENLYENSKIITQSAIITSKGKTLTNIPLQLISTKFGGNTVGIERSKLHSILLNRLKNIPIITNKKFLKLHQEKNKVLVYFEDGSVDSCDLVIGADGIHSNVRKHIDKETKLRWSGYTSWRGVTSFSHEYCQTGSMFEAWGRGVRFGFVPVSKNIVYWFATKNQRHPDSQVSKTKKEDLMELFSSFIEPIPLVLQSTNEEDIIKTDIFDLSPIKEWTSGRIILLGDAAHATTPNLGQGACLALEDAVELAMCLNRQGEIETNLKMFEKKRMKRVHSIVNQSWQLGKVAQMENSILGEIRNQLVKMTPKIVKQKHFDKTIGYRINDKRTD